MKLRYGKEVSTWPCDLYNTRVSVAKLAMVGLSTSRGVLSGLSAGAGVPAPAPAAPGPRRWRRTHSWPRATTPDRRSTGGGRSRPEDPSLRAGYLSFLDKRPEAIAQFRWVLGRADAGSTEYKEAHRWLARVGALPASPAVADSTRPSSPFPPDPSSIGRLVGKTEWPGITPHKRLITGQLSLMGDEPVTHDVKRTRAFRLGDGYEFRDVPAGRYRVVAVIEETMVWDEKVVDPARIRTCCSASPAALCRGQVHGAGRRGGRAAGGARSRGYRWRRLGAPPIIATASDDEQHDTYS
jgi:hypothetical protein